MKTLLSLTVLFLSINTYAQVGIGTTSPHSSALLEVSSNSKGFLPPRLTNAERKTLASPEPGLMIYNTDNDCIQYYNGFDWYDPCCRNSVDNGIDGFSYLLRLDPSDATKLVKMDTTDGSSLGVNPINEDYVYSFTSSTPGSETLVYASEVAGEVATNGHAVFQYTTTSNPIDYKSTSFISRVKNFSGTDASGIRYDLTPDHQGEFDIFLVARMDSSATPYPGYSSFFSSTDNSSNDYSFQIGVGNNTSTTSVNGTECTNEYYTINYRKTAGARLCGTTSGDRIDASDGSLHTFNINCSDNPTDGGTTKVFSLYIDGNLIESDSTLANYMNIDMLRLFSNRNTTAGGKSDISEILVFTSALTTSEREILNDYLVCKYGE